jgi:hypothetical protein
MLTLTLFGTTMILAASAVVCGRREVNPVERRVNKSLKRVVENGLPESRRVSKSTTHVPVLPELSSPIWA